MRSGRMPAPTRAAGVGVSAARLSRTLRLIQAAQPRRHAGDTSLPLSMMINLASSSRSGDQHRLLMVEVHDSVDHLPSRESRSSRGRGRSQPRGPASQTRRAEGWSRWPWASRAGWTPWTRFSPLCAARRRRPSRARRGGRRPSRRSSGRRRDGYTAARRTPRRPSRTPSCS